ncbi:CCA tRNA nucleotidyltransferase [Candidatus Tokpelaia sp.]|uniref:CCA tRNA nucleotidyltransferase n=1 Tax=Candidatus Tokpelaia sp. TaxID=2233777 RepID=UPI001238B159|nr:CCA tRNA nucleotidyltransferase [Candidatus Tokpelaia sp.]KAA6405827.1 CCA tRNA nucleotidyltransferase [Candidatus Tokpelaia sp.]
MKRFSTHNAFLQKTPEAAWLYRPDLQNLLAALAEPGEEARVVGGAVRDTLLQRPVTDIDIATTATPERVIERAQKHGFRIVPLGVEFGTVLVISRNSRFQVTSLRADIATDGRRAKVAFCRDWSLDAARRDFTVNALYVDKDGRLYDYSGGVDDIKDGHVRFIGEAQTRIKEDYLRILRFFRFYAAFGRGRPDKGAIMAIAALKEGLKQLSAERIWDEFKKLLTVPDPYRSLLWLRSCGVLDIILPESAKWGLDIMPGVIADEQAAIARGETEAADALLRLMALVPPWAERVTSLAKRLRLSGAEKRRLANWAAVKPIAPDIDIAAMKRRLYLAGSFKTDNQDKAAGQAKSGGELAIYAPKLQAVLDNLRLAAAQAYVYHKQEDYQSYSRLLELAQSWEIPQFPLSGGDLAATGLHGAAIGKARRRLEGLWVDSGFSLNKGALLAKL